jgi:hypothetical protein
MKYFKECVSFRLSSTAPLFAVHLLSLQDCITLLTQLRAILFVFGLKGVGAILKGERRDSSLSCLITLPAFLLSYVSALAEVLFERLSTSGQPKFFGHNFGEQNKTVLFN